MKVLGTAVRGVKMETNLIGAPSFSKVNPYNMFKHYYSDDYASAYPNIRAISNEYMKIRPFAIDGNGKPVGHPALDALYHPNKKDSSVMFAEKIAVSTLALPMTYILVWRKEGGVAQPGGDFDIGGKNIAGYTFLENPAISVVDKKIYYSIGSQTFSEDEVMALPGGVTPNDLYAGYSPTIASKRWATLDSYIADFQKGFFENNAIPAGMFIITAASEQDFEDTKSTMQEKHRGAGKNNNVSYVPRPMSQDGKPADSKVEWVPFAQSNKEIDFKPLLEHVDNRLSETYGVSGIIKGVDSNATYNNAEVSENGFAKRAVDPLALRNYTQITHELNRITGGIGIAITYKYDIPAISDQEKVKAETKNLEANLIRTMVAEPYNYSLESVVEAFQLSNSYKLLKVGSAPAVIDNDKPDVDEGSEVNDSPDPNKIDGVTPVNTLKPKAELSDEDKLKSIASRFMNSQIDKAIEDLEDEPETPQDYVTGNFTDEELDIFVRDMLGAITPIVLEEALEQHSKGVALLVAQDLSTDTLTDFSISDTQVDRYRTYLDSVGRSYASDTQKAIRSVLDNGFDTGLTKKEIEDQLKVLFPKEEWRAVRVARTELNRAGGNGSLFSMEQIQGETGYTIDKVWNTSSTDPCEYCRAMAGTTVSITSAFVPLGGVIDGVDGGKLVNDFVDMEIANSHPNCNCYLTYEVSS